jgi:hypothetical protein
MAHPTEAHFLATDGTIGAVVHVDPNDQPIAGSEAYFFFAFKDKANKFQPQNCKCIFEIVQNGKKIYSQQFLQNNTNPNLNTVSFTYFFPQPDVYEIKIIGRSIKSNAFQPFTLKWNFRVEKQTNEQTKTGQESNKNFFSTHIMGIISISILIICFIAYCLHNLYRKHIPSKGIKKDDEKPQHTTY